MIKDHQPEWWKTGVFYQIFPASFYDSNEDGFGDLRGIILKINYLSWLGVDALWLSPIFDSPLLDMGYDVTDYRSINPVFGDLADFRELLFEAHRKGIRVILDLVMNHTSQDHRWFRESRSSLENPKRNWYIWKTGRGKRKPNNWKSLYGGSAWTYDAATGEFYYHSFFKEQPDLNWRNPEVRAQFSKIVRFWLDMGVDGFRLDAINVIIKDNEFKDVRLPYLSQLLGRERQVTRNHPESYLVVEELRALVDRYKGRMLVGEIYALPPGNPRLAGSYLSDSKSKRLDMAFDFSMIFSRWSAKRYYHTINRWLGSIADESWPCNVISNHDLGRFPGFRNFDGLPDEKIKLMAVLLLTIKGTPFIYYGEELAMRNTRMEKDRVLDPLGKKFWPVYPGRDPSRTPMQWNNSFYSGFSQAEPWLPLNEDWKQRNVKNQMTDSASILNFYRELLALRKLYPSLQAGDWIPVVEGEKNVLAYIRVYRDEKILVMLNFSSWQKRVQIYIELWGKVLFSTHRTSGERVDARHLMLAPFEATLILVNYD